jgi:hypothetical protein
MLAVRFLFGAAFAAVTAKAPNILFLTPPRLHSEGYIQYNLHKQTNICFTCKFKE